MAVPTAEQQQNTDVCFVCTLPLDEDWGEMHHPSWTGFVTANCHVECGLNKGMGVMA